MAGKRKNRRQRVRRRSALGTSAGRGQVSAVWARDGRRGDVVAAVRAKNHAPVWLSKLDSRLQLAVFVHEKPRNMLGAFLREDVAHFFGGCCVVVA